MYVPSHFAVSPGRVAELLRHGGFAHLVTPTADGLVSTPLPLLYDDDAGRGGHGALLGHVARNNPHWRDLPDTESLAIFAGPDAYVSPGYYASKREHGRVVPTWNYEVLHVHGRLIAHDDVEWLRELVTRLTDAHEAGRDAPWHVTDAPERFIDGQLRAIVGLELVITRVESKAKLSQNRPEADQEGVIAGLTTAGEVATAAAMRAQEARNVRR
ncbi:FMN-binding negative transcriptional regulator [Cryptosporangium aurantiacum]|uniref:Negative transcriptional regulator, PaiB family n=1 Tax=Cryptosporangium aurantiacum TaxID=134849 RepID=A0A1M7RMH6_9ACTN|nr:FMN-binding negative transcriptional regulator [Cryptosporangium aurantiacum]SHN47535.1 negative transcriptional regulator, PaiB family [Cryptosporangium aurantiacum]